MITLEAFSDIFAVLAIRLRFTESDEAYIRVYHSALQDIEPELLLEAAERLGRTAVDADGRAWFPRAPEWRVASLKVADERWRALKARLAKLSTPLCSTCGDTGVRLVDEAERRFGPCDCQADRWLEMLGRRPMPALPPASEIAPVSATAVLQELEQRTGQPVMLHSLPHAKRVRLEGSKTAEQMAERRRWRANIDAAIAANVDASEKSTS